MLINQSLRSSKIMNMVRVIGLEPTRPKAPEPKSGASTNFATPAHKTINNNNNKKIYSNYFFAID